MDFMTTFMTTRKGMVLYKPKTDFSIRYIVVDYDDNFIYCVDLNSQNKIYREVVKFTYEQCNKDFAIE
jgi:hypothetical protein